MFKIAIIGRPNVGKSTFFNRLVGKRFAITDDFSGVTRDRKEAIGSISDIEFKAIDTAGLENEIEKGSLSEKMMEQTYLAIDDADLCLFLIDGKSGVLHKDQYFAKWLHKSKKDVILIANKCENFTEEFAFDNSYFALGFGKPLAISAEHKIGFLDLYDRILPFYKKYQENFKDLQEDFDEKFDLQVAIIGRPNAGKSTLLNKITNSERLITGQTAGITRDSIAVDTIINDKKIRFVDTAGIRKKARIDEKLEKMSTADSYRAMRFANVVILLFDANMNMDKQDLNLASEALKEGRSLIFAVNKIDTVKGDKEVFLKKIRKMLQNLFSEVNGAAILGISAINGYNVNKLISYIFKTYDQWQIKVPTAKLNLAIKDAVLQHPPKMMKGRETKIKYATQIKTRPPTFAIFTNNIKAIDNAYKAYLTNVIRGDFNLDLTPIRLYFRKSDNPYAKKD